ncbi:MAG: DUF1501 domain-containing protein, partial [Rhodocyclaceae bacterium]
MGIKRREFLKAASSAGCLASIPGVSQLAFAEAAQGNTLLVTIFLRGGADGLQLIGPAADPDYAGARPAELRVLDSGERAGILLDQDLASAAGFRLHPDAAPLGELYRAGRLAIVPAAGLPDGTRSHFVAEELIERGIADEKRLLDVADGWLTRSLANNRGLVPAYSATSAKVFALHGLTSTLAAPDLSGGLGLPWGAPTSSFLHTLASSGSSAAHRSTQAALDVLETVDAKIPRDGAGKIIAYKPEGKRSYDGSGDLARSLTSVARLAKMDVGLAAACVDFGGWDTHEGQSGKFAALVKQLATGIAAFQDDMAASGRKTVTIVMTEFGRRLRANKSGGTDHGHGGCWLVLGDHVRGGRMVGKWPGLATPMLDRGVDVAVTTDYRVLLAESLAACGLRTKEGLLDWRPST